MTADFRRIRVASYPGISGPNPYLRLFYSALGDSGIEWAGVMANNNSYLRAAAGSVDVLHFHWPENHWRWRGGFTGKAIGVAGFWRYLSLARSLGMRIHWTVHNHQHHEGVSLADRMAYWLLARYSDLCIFHDRHARDVFCKRYGVPTRRAAVMPHGNYDGVYSAARPARVVREGLGLDPSRRVLLMFGGVRPYKGVELVIDAARKSADFDVVIAGAPLSQDYGDELRRRAAGCTNLHFLLRHTTDEEFAELALAADGILLPYRSITGSGALLAALSLGRGVIASDLPFFRNYVAPEPDAAVLFTPGDEGAMLDAVGSYYRIASPVRGEAARRLADRYPWRACVEPVVRWYAKAFPDRACGV